MYYLCFLISCWQFLNIVNLLDERITNDLKLHIFLNIHENHSFTVNISQIKFRVCSIITSYRHFFLLGKPSLCFPFCKSNVNKNLWKLLVKVSSVVDVIFSKNPNLSATSLGKKKKSPVGFKIGVVTHFLFYFFANREICDICGDQISRIQSMVAKRGLTNRANPYVKKSFKTQHGRIPIDQFWLQLDIVS